jgi:hypothetical protein
LADQRAPPDSHRVDRGLRAFQDLGCIDRIAIPRSILLIQWAIERVDEDAKLILVFRCNSAAMPFDWVVTPGAATDRRIRDGTRIRSSRLIFNT